MTHVVRFSEFGGPEVLEVVETPTPEPGEGEVLVEVFAAGLNPVESAVRRGDHPERWPVEFPATQGRDLAGLVIATGPGASRFSRGDEVMGFVDHGAQATHVVVPEANLMPRPPALSWEVAGSLYTAGTTAWTAVEGLGLGPGDTIVVTAAAGGVGCLAAQFARMRGATVVGTQRRDALRLPPPVRRDPDGVRAGTRRPGARPRAGSVHRVPRLPRRPGARGAGPRRPRLPGAHGARLERGRRARRGTGLRRRRRRARTRGRARRGTPHPPADRRRVPARRRGRRVPRARQARGARQDRARPPHRRLRRVSAYRSPRSRSRT